MDGAMIAGPIRLGSEPDFSIGVALISPSSCEVRLPSRTVRLEPRVMQVLVALARAEGRAVSRDELLTRCWDGVIVSDHAINRVIAQLRQTFAAETGAPFRIETLPKVGYRLISLEGAAEGFTGASGPASPGDAPGEKPAPASGSFFRTRIMTAAAVAAALAAALAAAWTLTGSEARQGRWAVLPFATAAAPAFAPLAESLATKMRGALAGSGLAPAAYVDAAALRGPGVRKAAAREKVEFVLDGAIGRDGEAITIDANVVDVQSNQIVWSTSYRRGAAEAALLEEQVAAHAAGVLRCALISRKPRGTRVDPETLGVFLRACDQVQRFDGGRADTLAAGRLLTERAPAFTRGWSMLALAAAYASRGATGTDRAELQSLAANAATRALALDQTNCEAYLARAAVLPLVGAWSEREALIARALSLEPLSVEALLLQSELLAEQGRIEEALAANDSALAIEPLSPVTLAARLPLLATMEREREVRDLRERLYRTWPSSPSALFNRFNSMVYMGEHDRALDMLASGAVAPAPFIRDFLEAAAAGDADAKAQAVRTAVDLALAGKADRPAVIALASYAGFLDEAFALAVAHYEDLGVASSEPIAGAGRWVLFVRATEAMRQDPRFAELVDRLGLIERWRRSGAMGDICKSQPPACATH